MPRYLKLIVCIVFFTNNAFSQYSDNLIRLRKEIKAGKNSACDILKKTDTKSLSPADNALYLYLRAKCDDLTNIQDSAFDYFIRSKKAYLAIDSIDRAMEMNLEISYLLSAQQNNSIDCFKYANESLRYADKSNNLVLKAKTYTHLGMLYLDEEKYNQSLDYYKKAQLLVKKIGKPAMESVINNNLAVLFNEALKMPDSALYYLDKDLSYIKIKGQPQDYYYNYTNRASAYTHKGHYKEAIKLLLKADSLNFNSQVTKPFIYGTLALNYGEIKDYNNAYKYALLNKQFSDSLNITNQNISINEIQTKYQTAEKELENTVLRNDNKIQKIVMYAFIALFIVALIIAFLIVKNSRKREKIAAQDKLIEQQKLDKVLKDYELNSIDMMLEGQEKERQRLANDLHDNLGSMLATLKLNFENLKLRKNDLKEDENKLYDRTDELIQEAYQKVRRLAHAKNAGVFASQGLIPAIVKLAEKISIPGKLKIEVIPFGFTDRLDNTQEIAIFRIIQELATNIIKHSQATEATIHLTHHDDNINIIIEDNGVGFKPEAIIDADGMGLTSIRKKTKQLGGTFTIDATPNRGTTILIDLPV